MDVGGFVADEWTETVASLFGGENPGYSGGHNEMRRQYADFMKVLAAVQPTDLDNQVTVSTKRFTSSDGFDVRMLEVRPRIVAPCRLGVYYHGGGWTLGNPEGELQFVKVLAVGIKAVILVPAYRLAPEHPYPTPFNDCFETLTWIYSHYAREQYVCESVFVAGSSAGGNLAAAIAVKNRDLGHPVPISGQVLLVPCLIRPSHIPSHLQSSLNSYYRDANSPIITPVVMDAFWNYYNPPAHPYASPLLQESFSNLPPACVVVAGLDPLLDEGLLYAKLLSKAGVPVKVTNCYGFPHAFYLIPTMKASRELWSDLIEALDGMLSKGSHSLSISG